MNKLKKEYDRYFNYLKTEHICVAVRDTKTAERSNPFYQWVYKIDYDDFVVFNEVDPGHDWDERLDFWGDEDPFETLCQDNIVECISREELKDWAEHMSEYFHDVEEENFANEILEFLAEEEEE